MKRRAAYLLCALDALLYLVLLVALGRGELGGVARLTLTALILLTALPALLLTRARRAPDLALAFALAFPVALALLSVALLGG